ncbi:hypothetical protein O1M63_39205 [Streptomyces mirabilis]|nr:hypothetical protein [Streptomyces mirabilis]
MLLWRRLAMELRALLERLGAFRDIRVHGLDTRSAGALLRSRPSTRTPAALPASVADPSGGTLVLVISDGVGSLLAGRATARGAGTLGAPGADGDHARAALPHVGRVGHPLRAVAGDDRRRGAANDTWRSPTRCCRRGSVTSSRSPRPRTGAVSTGGRRVGAAGGLAGRQRGAALLAPLQAKAPRAGADTRGGGAADAVLRFRDAASPGPTGWPLISRRCPRSRCP